MTIRYRVELQCHGKRRYRHRGDARKAMRRQQTAGNGRGGRLTVYRCPWCDWYHIGNKPGTRTE